MYVVRAASHVINVTAGARSVGCDRQVSSVSSRSV